MPFSRSARCMSQLTGIRDLLKLSGHLGNKKKWTHWACPCALVFAHGTPESVGRRFETRRVSSLSCFLDHSKIRIGQLRRPESVQLRDTTENFPDDDEIFGCWIHTIDFALDFHWKSIFSEKIIRVRIPFLEIFFKSTQNIFCGSIFKNSDVLKRKNPSPFILHHKLACFIDGNTLRKPAQRPILGCKKNHTFS